MAATTDTLGPNPSLRTMYGYDAPMMTATTNPAVTARGVNSRVPGGLCGASCSGVSVSS